MPSTRRGLIAAGLVTASALGSSPTATAMPQRGRRRQPLPGSGLDPVRAELVLDLLLVTGPAERSALQGDGVGPDGLRTTHWPIVGGRFQGRGGLRGSVVAGGADTLVQRLDGVTTLEALYRLRTEDGYQVIVHHGGLLGRADQARTVPRFTVNRGPHEWLNRAMFIALESPQVPATWRMAARGQQDRLFQVYRLV